MLDVLEDLGYPCSQCVVPTSQFLHDLDLTPNRGFSLDKLRLLGGKSVSGDHVRKPQIEKFIPLALDQRKLTPHLLGSAK